MRILSSIWWVIIVLVSLSSCSKSNSLSPSDWDPNGFDLDTQEVYYSPAGFIRDFTNGFPAVMVPVPAGSFVIKVRSIEPSRGSTLTEGQLVRIGFLESVLDGTPSPYGVFRPVYHPVDSTGNDLPSRFLAGGAGSLDVGEMDKFVNWAMWFSSDGIPCGQPFDIRIQWGWNITGGEQVIDEHGKPIQIVVPLGWKGRC